AMERSERAALKIEATAPQSICAGPTSRAANAWWLFCALVLAIKLLLLWLDPIPKLYMGDSGSYIWTALTGWIPPDRSFFYGYVIRWTALWTPSLTVLLVVQVCLSAMTWILFSSITRVSFEFSERWSYVFGFVCA